MKSTSLTIKKRSLSEMEATTNSPAGVKEEMIEKTDDSTSLNVSSKVNPKSKNPFTVVAIGASAGGLEAITQLLENLSPTTGMAFIYVQHLSPDHKSMLTPLLSKATKMLVQDIDNMEKMEPNNVYVIPYNKVIEVTDGHIRLSPRPKEKTYILSIDVLFSSLAETHKENVIGIILSGSNTDGTRGLYEIKSAGGLTFAQDDSAKFATMPESAIAKGVVDFILSPKEIADKLNWMSKHSFVRPGLVKIAPENEIENNNYHLNKILQILLKEKKVDFSHYKMNTIKRRMIRRMMINKVKTLKLYSELIEQKTNEVDLLYQDLLINVTDFFRDADVFLLLRSSLLPRLIKTKAPGETLRIWVAACATGEEVYSIAMMLLEMKVKITYNIPFQIFGTDLSPKAIAEARTGEYTLHQLKNVSPKRLQRFFVKLKDKYRVSKEVRDVCVFAKHNILSDPPFSHMDLISCRNFLIYLDTLAQKKAISTFHYGLNESGCLLLGKSETVGASVQLFSILDKKFKVYTRKNVSGPYKIPDLTPHISQMSGGQLNTKLTEMTTNTSSAIKKTPSTNNGNLSNAFDAILLSQFVPASVIINYDLEILQFRGSTSLYLQHASGRASFNILKMVDIEITFELRNAIHHAIKTNQTVRKMGIEMNRNQKENTVQIVNIEVTPLEAEGEEPLLVVAFSGHQMELGEHSVQGTKSNSLAKDRRIKKLEEELAAARADMGSITQDQEAANEELQSANEEIVSSNEELQSLNEELETSKEEIESTNEELSSSNQELNARIQQIEDLNTYHQVILDTVHEPMLILDKQIRIVSANKSFCKTFHVSEKECLGISLYKLGNNQWNILQLRELLEDVIPKNIRFQDFEVEHTFPVIGNKTMLLNAHRIILQSQDEELIVLTIADITEVKKLAIDLQEKENKELEEQLAMEKKELKLVEDSNKRYNMMLLQSPFAIAILKGKDMTVSLANKSMKEMLGKGRNIEGKNLAEVLPEYKDQPFCMSLDKVYTTGEPYYGYKLTAKIKHKGKLVDAYYNFVYQPYREADDEISGVTVIAYDVTTQIIAKNELIIAKENAENEKKIAEVAVKAKQQFLSNMSHEIRTPMNAIIGFTNVVLKTKLDESQREYISAIKTSGDALIILINDILDLAKVDAGKMTFVQAPFDLSHSLSMVIQLFETKINEKNLELINEFDSKIPQFVIGDSMRLRQIILNLLSNAVKFTVKGEIIIRVTKLKEYAGKISIEFKIIDTGIGIRKERLGTIFNNFEQADAETSSLYGGSGLGLAIVKKLVELQGGTILVDSEPGKGSTFGFVLTFEKSTSKNEIETVKVPEQIQNSSLTDKEFNKVSVLVVEDMALNQLLIKIILLEFGFEIETAENGKIAIEKMGKNVFDIILMDLQMPVMNGFDATTYIREKMKSQIPIIALTADVTTIDVDKCKAVGMNDYISKPIDEKILYSKIMKCLK